MSRTTPARVVHGNSSKPSWQKPPIAGIKRTGHDLSALEASARRVLPCLEHCWTEVDLPAGPVRALPPPVRGAGGVAALGPIPAVGEHTGEILGELGYTDTEVAALRDARVV